MFESHYTRARSTTVVDHIVITVLVLDLADAFLGPTDVTYFRS